MIESRIKESSLHHVNSYPHNNTEVNDSELKFNFVILIKQDTANISIFMSFCQPSCHGTGFD